MFIWVMLRNNSQEFTVNAEGWIDMIYHMLPHVNTLFALNCGTLTFEWTQKVCFQLLKNLYLPRAIFNMLLYNFCYVVSDTSPLCKI